MAGMNLVGDVHRVAPVYMNKGPREKERDPVRETDVGARTMDRKVTKPPKWSY